MKNEKAGDKEPILITRKPKHKIEHWHKITALLIAYDIVTIILSYFLALWVRFDCAYTTIPRDYFHTFLCVTPFYAIVCVAVFWWARLYQSIWRFASFSELYRVFFASLITGSLHTAVVSFFIHRMPISYYLWGTSFQFMFTLAVRFSYRFVILEPRYGIRRGSSRSDDSKGYHLYQQDERGMCVHTRRQLQ